MKISKYFQFAALVMMVGGMAACSDDDMSVRVPDYDPNYKGNVEVSTADEVVDYNAHTIEIKFQSDMEWTATVVDGNGDECTWATISPDKGELPAGVAQVAGVAKEPIDFTVTLNISANDDYLSDRTCAVRIATPKGTVQTFTVEQEHRFDLLTPAEVPNYDKFYYPGRQDAYFKSQDDLLRSDSPYSWFNCKQSEHFFLFWDKQFGSDPNAESVPANLRVDTDDLLAKAEHFFDTNVNVLGMCTLGQGKSMLDNYKMQIWLIYDEGWTATGSGWGEIGALWVTPATCHPVGSTIAHEIGHSFQFQVGADRAHATGEEVWGFGFRYGFGPNGEGGCAYWEQCAQWQAHQDYPEEQNSYHTGVWRANYHRHFNHEWMRYASYYLQTYWTNTRGINAYGRIWQESNFPEDPIETYTRLYLNGDFEAFYDEYYDYAAHMVYYDLDGVRQYFTPWEQGNYTTQLFLIDENKYQVGYASTPGTTGFNIIDLKVPAAGTNVSISIKALEHGSALAKGDPGTLLNGDGQKVGSTDCYNATGAAANYRMGYVAIVNGTPKYSAMTKGDNATASYVVPEGTEELYFVIAATPAEYNSHEWNDNEIDDEQWPYVITVDGAEVASYEEAVDLSGVDVNGTPTDVAVTINIHAAAGEQTYDFAHFNLAYRNNAAICYAFCMMPDDIDARLVHPMDLYNAETGELIADPEGKVVMRLKQTDGSYCYTDNCGGEYGGFWCDGEGNLKGWGEGTYTKLHGITDMEVGYMPGWGEAGNVYPEVIELVYTKGGKQYIATFTFNFYID